MSESKSNERAAVRWNRGKVIRKDARRSVCFSVKGPADRVLAAGVDNGGVYLFEDGWVGRFVDESECFDPDCWDEGVIGALTAGMFGPDGSSRIGAEYPYKKGMTFGELCAENGLAKPKRTIPVAFYNALEDGADHVRVFGILNLYLNGRISEESAVARLEVRAWRHRTK